MSCSRYELVELLGRERRRAQNLGDEAQRVRQLLARRSGPDTDAPVSLPCTVDLGAQLVERVLDLLPRVRFVVPRSSIDPVRPPTACLPNADFSSA